MTQQFYITGTRRGLGKYLENQYNTVSTLEQCDIFINCKHDGFEQVNLLYQAVELEISRIINISSNSGDGIKKFVHPYAVQKAALDKANEQLFYQGINTTSIRFGYFDSERVSHVTEPKMSLEYCAGIVEWVLQQPYRVKELTITP